MKKTRLNAPTNTPYHICTETGLKIYSLRDLPKDIVLRVLRENRVSGISSPINQKAEGAIK